jgi:hypothetical protein
VPLRPAPGAKKLLNVADVGDRGPFAVSNRDADVCRQDLAASGDALNDERLEIIRLGWDVDERDTAAGLVLDRANF